MIVWAALGLLCLRLALGQSIPEPGPATHSPAAHGDLLFLLDSSASVSYYEFSRVKEFVGQLVQPLPLGPGAVQTSMVHVGSKPTVEFSFDQHRSGAAAQEAIRAAKQLMGDTNTGLALDLAKEQLFTTKAGARPGVRKVLVWVTDGGSSDDAQAPMQALKDLGVTVFIISTGRGNFLDLSAAASQPPEKHLRFVDVDDLQIIIPELRGSILEAMRPQELHATEVTSHSFRLAWPPLLSGDSGYYLLEVAPSADPGAKQSRHLLGNETGWFWDGLEPSTTYKVVLVPESNLQYLAPQTTQVTTLEEEVSPAWILISHSKPHSFHVSWAPTPVGVLRYEVLYGPLPGGEAQLLQVPATKNSTTLENLSPNTTYLVTVAAIYRSGREKALSAKACTQEVASKIGHLYFQSLGSSTVKASWDSAEGDVQGYQVRCQRQVGPPSLLSVSPQTHSVVLTGLAAGTTNHVCVTPIYQSHAGSRRCQTVRMHPVTPAPEYRPT
ncbi:von Willebrand factor A domain-containing protein 1 isoform X2 [Vombatus ursinus]|uniref:von Willebrand factor A domain-containing protein 1 n=1 Tax=Vombatus ursinus TaxID=29139 RepID=A0A4X2LZA2_VOMUR|nr:von Willebrand factor A domain-containing protein 1 isoform X2 [Vombatus ursinus]